MKYLETRILYTDDTISKIIVLVDCTSVGKPFSDVRAIMATDKPCNGYEYIRPGEPLTSELISRVADYGLEINPNDAFPGWRKTYYSNKTDK